MPNLDENSFIGINIIEKNDDGKECSYLSFERLKNIDSFGTGNGHNGYFLTLESPLKRSHLKIDRESLIDLMKTFDLKIETENGVSALDNPEFNL
jgi:hypothetical protein